MLGSTITMDMSHPWMEESAMMRQANGNKYPMSALRRRTTCGEVMGANGWRRRTLWVVGADGAVTTDTTMRVDMRRGTTMGVDR
ncbi:hypothetical protein GUJ93_ZPchr0008g12985 [Zizania palustris]|uniref:Uncharacterized protein n=1 Tax=Zizania palustris TaxID=103762 RepID=A0A8J5V264_ZIZPA|nr:hypothetical protein GUJ93_ZPchr0008g12985 [Zizania palustris]